MLYNSKSIVKDLDDIEKALQERQSGQDVIKTNVQDNINKIKQEFQDIKGLDPYADKQNIITSIEQNITTADKKMQDIEKQMEKRGYGIVAGIYNVGNTCYMNSALQVLAALYVDKIQSISNNNSVCNELKQIIKTINKGYENVTKDTMSTFLSTLDRTYSCGIGAGNKFLDLKEQDSFSFFEIITKDILANVIYLGRNITTVQQGINKYFIKKSLQDDDDVLPVIHFSQTDRTGKKINNSIQDPLTFTVAVQNTVSKKSLLFALSAFIVHIGDTLKGGHYVGYIKKTKNGIKLMIIILH